MKKYLFILIIFFVGCSVQKESNENLLMLNSFVADVQKGDIITSLENYNL